MKKVFTRQAIQYGAKIPFGYGIAYRDFAMDVAICYPIPINLVVRWVRNFYEMIAYRIHSTMFQKQLEDIATSSYEKGFKAGQEIRKHEADKLYRQGYENGFQSATAEIYATIMRELENGKSADR